MSTNIYISEIVATRLSHDLIGNIGAVANAVELLNEGDEDDREDIGNILNFSSKVLSRRLKFSAYVSVCPTRRSKPRKSWRR